MATTISKTHKLSDLNLAEYNVEIRNYLQKFIDTGIDISPLNAEKEKEYLYRIKVLKDEDAKTEFIYHNLLMVVKTTFFLQNVQQRKLIPLEDLINEGFLGLFHALDKFDLSVGTRFSTYAAQWVSQSMQAAIDHHGRVIRVQPSKLAIIKKYRIYQSDFESKGILPTFDMVAEQMQYKKSTIREALEMIEPISLSATQKFGNVEGKASIADTIEDDSHDIADGVSKKELSEILDKIEFNKFERIILSQLFGLDGEEKTFEEIAEEFNVTVDFVVSQEHHAFQKIRHCGMCQEIKDIIAS